MRPVTLPADHTAVPVALADLHLTCEPGDEVAVVAPPEGPLDLEDLLVGAGFAVADGGPRSADGRTTAAPVVAVRRRTLPDTVGPQMRLLVCGLNPSEHAADAGVGFARPGNRFWPAALAAGVVTADRDPRHALTVDGLGMTDLVKRATRRADQLTAEEYVAGVARVGRLAAWLRPGAICFVGLAGWRAAVDRRAVEGPQPDGLGGRPAYVMGSTSGLNANATLDSCTAHLAAAMALADT